MSRHFYKKDYLLQKKLHIPSKRREILEHEVAEVLKTAVTVKEAAKLLGTSMATFLIYAKKYDLYNKWLRDVKMSKMHRKPKRYNRISMQDLLDGKSTKYSPTLFRRRLFLSGLKSPECEMCGIREQRIVDGEYPLLHHFLDGNKNNTSLENIQIMCFNCSFLYHKNFMGKNYSVNKFKKNMESSTTEKIQNILNTTLNKKTEHEVEHNIVNINENSILTESEIASIQDEIKKELNI